MTSPYLLRPTRTLRQAADDVWDAYKRMPNGPERDDMLARYIELMMEMVRDIPTCVERGP